MNTMRAIPNTTKGVRFQVISTIRKTTWGVFIHVCMQRRWAPILSYGLNVLEGVAAG